jgi:transposase InsO family protein
VPAEAKPARPRSQTRPQCVRLILSSAGLATGTESAVGRRPDMCVDVALVVDAYARRILGWRVAATMATSMVLDAIEQAI